MAKELPGNLSEIFPLRLRLREELSFTPSEEHVMAFRLSNGKRYSLKPWQYVMVCRLDGEKTYEQLGREVYQEFSGLITAQGLLNFYSWLYSEDLVRCQYDSVFELVTQEEEKGASRVPFSKKLTGIASHPKVPVVAMSMVGVLLCLAVVRIAYVVAPVIEPPVDRLYSEIGERFMKHSETPTVERQAMVSVAEPVVESIEPAAQMEEISEPPALAAEILSEKVEAGAGDTKSVDAAAEKESLMNRMDTLRQEMAGCRIRRDEFYLQNNEDGYRREVEKMTELAKEIGEVGTNL